jgi:hypothetical protein
MTGPCRPGQQDAAPSAAATAATVGTAATAGTARSGGYGECRGYGEYRGGGQGVPREIRVAYTTTAADPAAAAR